jgi:alginate O-acetyltransferase complex protein AlgJ
MESGTAKGVRAVQAVFGFAVFATLCLPLLVWRIGPQSLAREKPGASPWPEMPRTRTAVRAWPAAVERFVQEHIGLRDAAVRGYNGLVYFALRSSPTPLVVRGRDGWLFYNSVAEPFERADTIADARRSRPLSARRIKTIACAILARDALVSSWHGRYLLVIAPNKSSVYPEQLPAALTPVRRGKPLEQLAFVLTPAPGGPFLDLTPFLLDAKRNGAPVYHRTDSHWTQVGALRGFVAIMSVLQADCPDLRTPHEGDFVVQQLTTGGRDLARLLGLVPLFREPDWRLTLKADLALPAVQRRLRVWVYRDSFYAALPHVWKAYLPGLVDKGASEAWRDEEVSAARPDVVIQLIVERRLRSAW